MSDKTKYAPVDPSKVTFPSAFENKKEIELIDEEERKRVEKEQRIHDLKNSAQFPHLPNDPIYRPIPEELLEVNEMSKNLEMSTRIMINVALSDYAVFRKVDEKPEDPENIKLNFKRVNYDEFGEYQEVQDQIDDINNRIAILNRQSNPTMETYDRIREFKKELKKTIDSKVDTGLRIFFKSRKEYDMVHNKKAYDYNDLLLNVEIGFFRYTRAPFLRQISSKSI